MSAATQLIAVFDVAGMTPEQIGALECEVVAQATDSQEHPDTTVRTHTKHPVGVPNKEIGSMLPKKYYVVKIGQPIPGVRETEFGPFTWEEGYTFAGKIHEAHGVDTELAPLGSTFGYTVQRTEYMTPYELDGLDAHCPESLLEIPVSEWPDGLTAVDIHREKGAWVDTVTLRGTSSAIVEFLAANWYNWDTKDPDGPDDTEGFVYDVARMRQVGEES